MNHPNTERDEGITGFWIKASRARHCLVCLRKDGKVLLLTFGVDEMLVCAACGVALRELLTDALEDDHEQH